MVDCKYPSNVINKAVINGVGVVDGVTDGVIEGVADGVAEGVTVGVVDGVVDGVVEGVTDGVGVTDESSLAVMDGDHVKVAKGWLNRFRILLLEPEIV